jgi:hypothetical protein
MCERQSERLKEVTIILIMHNKTWMALGVKFSRMYPINGTRSIMFSTHSFKDDVMTLLKSSIPARKQSKLIN